MSADQVSETAQPGDSGRTALGPLEQGVRAWHKVKQELETRPLRTLALAAGFGAVIGYPRARWLRRLIRRSVLRAIGAALLTRLMSRQPAD
ncbi:MAG TPA: hypothetical protein VKN99_15450 [Polyangia bacterium]|nr:hypothetical protein [Polyangia bacterium]